MKNFIFIICLLFLSSCATTYSCNTKTAGKCQSISEVYDNVDKDSGHNSPSTEIAKENDLDSFKRFKLKEPLEGKAVLSEPQVLRVLLNYWEDEEKDLNLGGYVFVKVREAEWQIP